MTTTNREDPHMTEDELLAAAEDFLPADPFEDGDSDDNDYQDDLRYEESF